MNNKGNILGEFNYFNLENIKNINSIQNTEEKNELLKKATKNIALYGNFEENLDKNKFKFSFNMRRSYFLNNLTTRMLNIFHSSMRNLFLISNIGIVFYAFGKTIKNKDTALGIKITSLITLLMGLFYINNIYKEFLIYLKVFQKHDDIIVIATMEGMNNYKRIIIFYTFILILLVFLVIYNIAKNYLFQYIF